MTQVLGEGLRMTALGAVLGCVAAYFAAESSIQSSLRRPNHGLDQLCGRRNFAHGGEPRRELSAGSPRCRPPADGGASKRLTTCFLDGPGTAIRELPDRRRAAGPPDLPVVLHHHESTANPVHSVLAAVGRYEHVRARLRDQRAALSRHLRRKRPIDGHHDSQYRHRRRLGARSGKTTSSFIVFHSALIHSV